jgi:hypothetical protein
MAAYGPGSAGAVLFFTEAMPALQFATLLLCFAMILVLFIIY